MMLLYIVNLVDRTNVGFAEIVSRDRIRLRVWERGVGETKACGTGACAALVAASGIETVYVFRLRGGTWSQTARLTTSHDGGPDDAFGTSVALSGDGTTALVGAPFAIPGTGAAVR